MTIVKKTIIVTDDNWADYFHFDFPESLVQGLEIGDGGIDRDSSAVTPLLAWVTHESGLSPNTRYEMSRLDAAVVLELMAGWQDWIAWERN